METFGPTALKKSAELLTDLINKWDIPPRDTAYDSHAMKEFSHRAGAIPFDIAYGLARQLHGARDNLAVGTNANAFALGLFLGGANAAVQGLLLSEVAPLGQEPLVENRLGEKSFAENRFVEDVAVCVMAITPAIKVAFGFGEDTVATKPYGYAYFILRDN